MPAMFESGMFGSNQPAWHGCGNVFKEDVLDTPSALVLAGLDWTVSPRPLFAPTADGSDFVKASDDLVAIVRDSDESILAVVGSRYRPVQNVDALSIIDEVLRSEGAKWHTAGSLDGGRLIWGLAKFPEGVYLQGMPADLHEDYLLVTNAHDGRFPFTIMPTRVRVVCNNTLNMALAGHARRYEVKHTLGAEPRIDEARKALGVAKDYFAGLTHLSEELISQPFSDRQWEMTLNHLLELPDKPRAYENRVEERDSVTYLWKASETLDGMPKCKYRAVNAWIEWDNHFRKSRNSKGLSNAVENRMKAILLSARSVADDAVEYVKAL